MTEAAGPQIGVVIPHYDQLASLAECLASLDRQSLPRERFEIVVVDNASPCGIAAVAEVVAGRALLVEETGKGAGPARNRGVAETHAPVLAFIDADCVASPQWLEEGLKGLERYDVVGGRVDVSVADEAHMSGVEAFERVFAFDFRSYIEDKGFTGAGNLFCRRATFDRVGGFRRAVSEDRDWSFRATALGFSLGYHDAAAIAHPARGNWGELARKWQRLNRETLLLASELPHGEWRFLARSYLLPASIVPHSWRVLTSAKLPGWRSRLRGLGTLARIRLWRVLDAHRAVGEWRRERAIKAD